MPTRIETAKDLLGQLKALAPDAKAYERTLHGLLAHVIGQLEYLDASPRREGGSDWEPTVEEWEALELCVKAEPEGRAVSDDAREALRKLNAASALQIGRAHV